MRSVILLGALLCVFVSFAFAGTTVYGSPAAFQAATSGNVLLDFNAAPLGPIIGNEFTANGFVFTAPGGPLSIGAPDFFSSSNYLNVGEVPYHCCDGDFDTIEVQIVGNYQAFAVRFVDSFLPSGAGEYIDVFDQSNNLLLHYTGPYFQMNDPVNNFFFDSFFGVVADMNVGRIVIYENANDVDDVGYDDFQLANVRGQVPEPGSMLLFGSGLLALAGVLRRKLA